MKTRFIVLSAIVLLSYIAEKCKQLTEPDGEPRKERFPFANCFDWRYGTAICLLKIVAKIIAYHFQARRVQSIREAETRRSFSESLSKGERREDALKMAREAGKKRARQARVEFRHALTPLLSSVWDYIEILYGGGTPAEGLVRSIVGFLGAYGGGLVGEEDGEWIGFQVGSHSTHLVGWIGFQVGSHLGGWFGDRVGLMAYDIGNGVLKLMEEFHSSPLPIA